MPDVMQQWRQWQAFSMKALEAHLGAAMHEAAAHQGAMHGNAMGVLDVVQSALPLLSSVMSCGTDPAMKPLATQVRRCAEWWATVGAEGGVR